VAASRPPAPFSHSPPPRRPRVIRAPRSLRRPRRLRARLLVAAAGPRGSLPPLLPRSPPSVAPLAAPPRKRYGGFASRAEIEAIAAAAALAALNARGSARQRASSAAPPRNVESRPPPRSDVIALFRQLSRTDAEVALQAAQGPVCRNFARGACTRPNCRWAHVGEAGGMLARAASTLRHHNEEAVSPMGRADLLNTRGGVKRAEAGHNAPTIDGRSWTAIVSAPPAPPGAPAPVPAAARDDDSAAVAVPAREPREHPVFSEDASPRELRFVALLCERAAARFESDAKALTLHFAFVRKIGESVATQWGAAGASTSLSLCLAPECAFAGTAAAVLLHERTVHAASAVDLHALHLGVALRNGRDPGAFRLACLPSLGKSCWLTASLAMFEVIVARAGDGAREKACRHPAIRAALENPSADTARALANALRMSAEETASPMEALERLLVAVGSLKSVWPTTADSGVCPNCQDIFEVGAPVDSPIIFVPGPAAADAPALRKAIAEPGSYTCTAQVPITDPTPAVPAHPDHATGEIFEDRSDADGEAEVATQPCGFRAPIARTCGDIIMLETPAGISGKWPRALQIEVSGAPRRYATAAAFIEVNRTHIVTGVLDGDSWLVADNGSVAHPAAPPHPSACRLLVLRALPQESDAPLILAPAVLVEPAYTRQRYGAIDSDDDEEMHNLFGSPSESRGPTPHSPQTPRDDRNSRAHTQLATPPRLPARAPSREAPQRWTDQPRRQVTTAGGAGSSAPNRVRMSWLLVPLLGAAAHAAPCPGLCYLAVHALGVPLFAAVVALIRRCGAAPHETAFDGTNYLPAAVQERHFGMVQVRVSHSAHSAADRELIGHVEDALNTGPPTITPPAPSSVVPSANATFTTSRGSFTIAEVRGGYLTLRHEGASYSDIPAVAGVTAAIPSNYALAGAPAPQLPDREPSALILTAVLACVVSVTPNTSAASAAIACIRPEVFSRIVATFRATPGGSTLVNHTAFSSGSLRRDRCTEAWNAIRDLAAASPDIARCAITMSNARPPPTCRPKIRWQRCAPPSSATSSFAVSTTTVFDGSSWKKARASLRSRPSRTHANSSLSSRSPSCALRRVRRTARHSPLTRRGLTSFRSRPAPRRRTPSRHSPRRCALSRAPLTHLPSDLGAHAAHRGYRGNSTMKRARSPPHVADAPFHRNRKSPVPLPGALRSPLPPILEIAALNWPVFDSIPQRARPSLAAAFARTVAELDSPDGWTLLFAFARVVLAKPRSRRCTSADVMIARSRRWPHEAAELLRGVADDYAASPPPRQSEQRFPVADIDLPRGWSTPELDTSVDLDSLPSDVARKVLALARRGYFSRAVASLSAAAVVSEPDAAQKEAMQALHPEPSVPTAIPAPPDFPFSGAPSFPMKAVRKALHGFVLGSAGGMSRLTPRHLLDLAAYSGSTSLDTIGRVVARFADGRLPADARRFFFGARLVALAKVGGGLRPIACGDVFRRMAAKLLCARAGEDAAAFLANFGQLGVACESGMDGITHAARRYAAEFLRPGSGRCILKVDVRNAFNTCSRSDFLHVVREQFPELFNYAAAAYGHESLLQFADAFLASRAGVHQGDPLGPLFFALALVVILQSIDTDALELNAWYLDDGTVGATTLAIRAFLNSLAQVAREHDLTLNFSKCEIVCADADVALFRNEFPEITSIVPVSSFFLLGTPLGSAEVARAKVEVAAERSTRRARLITALPDPVVATALLRHTTGFCIGNFYARGVGVLARTVFAGIDAATISAFEAINFSLDEGRRELARLPTACGGFGLRSIADHCGIAFVAATVAAHELFPALLSQQTRDQLARSADTWLVLDDPVLLRFPPVAEFVTRYVDDGVAVRHAQRMLSRRLDRATSDALSPSLPEALQTRIVSAASPHANAWLAPAPGADAPRWLSPADWDVLIRRRLVLPIAAAPSRCGNCGVATADVYGDHSVVCMHGPARYKIHNAIRDTTVRVCQEALLSPIVEPELPGGGRGDVLLRFPGPAGNRSLVVVDFAMTTIATRPRAALAAPGGAATRYEQIKRDKYQTRADEMGAELVPVIVDDAGAWGESALPFWKRIIRRFAQRFDLAMSKASVVVMGAVSSAMMTAVAQAIRSSAIKRPS
jgi:hypothetical protein